MASIQATSIGSERTLVPYWWMLCGCFALAWMGQFAHLVRNNCDWRIVALARTSLALVFAVGLARVSGANLVLWRPAALWLRGIASSLSLLCTFYALAQLPTSEVFTLTNTVPIWVAFLSWPMLGVRPSLAVWLAALCGVAGVALIQSPQMDSDSGNTLAVMLSLSAALTSAIAMLGLHRLKGVHPWAIVVHYSAVSTIVVAASWAVGAPVDLAPLQEPVTLLLLLGIGIAATIGQVCVTQAYTLGAPARVAVVGLMQIVFALGLDVIVDMPDLPLATLAGISLVVLPTAWVMIGKARHEPSPASEPKSVHRSTERAA